MTDELNIQHIVKRLFKTPDGETVLKFLVENYVMASPYTPNVTELQLAYGEGKSDLVRLLHQVTNSNI